MLQAIKNFIKLHNDTKYYTFKKVEHELVLLKKLEDDKIFYNYTIYEKDFFYYHKLEGFIEQIYELRNDFISMRLNKIFADHMESKTRQQLLRGDQQIFINFIEFDPNNCDEINDLTLDQYIVLVNGYTYNFFYELPFDLLNPKIKIPSSSIKPIIKDFFYDWFYILGWKSIKPVYPTFDRPLHWHYDDDIREELIFRNRYHPLQAGTRSKPEWLVEYNEQKKFDEFDINCKTNSYYMRYLPYNEVYNKDYPEDKKFKTDLIHDFTEEEIKENYENMIDKEKLALDKFNFVMFNEKRRTAVLKFFEELEIIEVSNEKLLYDFHWNHDQDSDLMLGGEIDLLLYELLNNPRYILVMPLVDAYFEVFRSKGWYYEDESFLAIRWGDNNTHKKFMKYLMYFEFSYERQYTYGKKKWLVEDYLEIEDLEYDEHYEDEYYALGLGLGLIIWLMILNLYIIIYWFSDLNIPFGSPSFLPKYYHSLRACFSDKGEDYLHKLARPEVYYGLELKRPRSRILTKRFILPLKFYESGYYSYTKKKARNMLPLTLLDKINYDLDEKDYGLNDLDRKLRRFGRRHLLFKIRIPYIEEPYFWTPDYPSPWQTFKDKVAAMKKDFNDNHRSRIKYEYWYPFRRKYLYPIRDKYFLPNFRIAQSYYDSYVRPIKNSVINFFKAIKNFFKKPTN